MSNVLMGNVPSEGTMTGNISAVFGRDGKSAYELAVKNGYIGTEAEWLESLKCTEIADGIVTSSKFADGSINRDELFSDEMKKAYLSLPVKAVTFWRNLEGNDYNSFTEPGIYQIDSFTGMHKVLIVLSPDSDSHLMQILLSYDQVLYRGIWCTTEGIYADEDWEEWVDITEGKYFRYAGTFYTLEQIQKYDFSTGVTYSFYTSAGLQSLVDYGPCVGLISQFTINGELQKILNAINHRTGKCWSINLTSGEVERITDNVNIGYDITEDRNFYVTANIKNGQLRAELNYPEVKGGEVVKTLDDVAYEGKTFREIFVNGNAIDFSDFEDGWGSAVVATGSPTITDEASCTGTHSLKCFGTASQQLKVTSLMDSSYGGKYYVAMKVRMDRYESGGGIGVSWSDVFAGANTVLFNKTTNGEFVTVSHINNGTPNSPFFFGGLTKANLDAYIDDLVLINLNIFSTTPTKEQMDALYEEYISILLGKTSSVEGLPEKTVEYLISKQSLFGDEPTESECVAAFMKAVTEKATRLGMNNSTFTTSSGAGGNISTARDLMRMMINACGYKDLLSVWGKKGKNVTPINSDTTLEFTSSIQNSSLVDKHYVFGGKTGSWGDAHSLAVVSETNDGKWLVGVVMNATSADARFTAMEELLDIACKAAEGEDISNMSVSSATAAIAALVPNNVFGYDNYPFTTLFEQNPDVQHNPASVSKVMTSITMLDYLTNIHETLNIIETDDDMGGSGNVFSAGDIITFEDALYAMMLPSSNQTAQAVARNIGRRILERYT